MRSAAFLPATRARRSFGSAVPIVVAGLAAFVTLVGCTGRGARDAAGDRGPGRGPGRDVEALDAGGLSAVPEPPAPLANAEAAAAKPRVLVKGAARAITLDPSNVYFGNGQDDGVFAVPKAGGEAMRLARRAPVAGCLALDGEALSWVASPGDAVLRVSIHGLAVGAAPATVRDKGIFAGVATWKGDTFVTEVVAGGGSVVRISGGNATKLAQFDGPPRGILADATNVYVITPTKIFRMPHAKGEVETILTGKGMEWATLGGDRLYVIADGAGGAASHDVIAIPTAPAGTAGAAPTVLARGARDAPIVAQGGELLYFDAQKPRLLAVPIAGGISRVLADDEALSLPTALAADASTAFVAAGTKEDGAIYAVIRKR